MPTEKKARELLNDAQQNKSTAFTEKERDQNNLGGLLPYGISTQDTQVERVMANVRRFDDDVDEYLALSQLRSRNERLFCRVLTEHTKELLPIIYTPTIGEVCKQFSHLFTASNGFYITPRSRGMIKEHLKNWGTDEVKVIVITDGERILGLGDLGADGMGIPIGKLSLYTAFGGINPSCCLPVMFDIGTNNPRLLSDPLYLGYPHERLKGAAYNELMDEFVEAVMELYPGVLLQFEDFLTPNAFLLLERYRNKLLCFNDDIQGTAAVAMAGILSSTISTGKDLVDLTFLFAGAGSAATGVADLLVEALILQGDSRDDALGKIHFTDVHGALTLSRKDLLPHNLPYAKGSEALDLHACITQFRPDVLIGATGAKGIFDQKVIEEMSRVNDRPVIFALSNPTSKAECTAEEAYGWSKGKVIFVTGSPFDPVVLDGKTHNPGQGNNAYIFPGLGLGLLGSGAKKVDDGVLIAAARALANEVRVEERESGSLYPELDRIRDVSLAIATAVADHVFANGLTIKERPADLQQHLREMMYDPEY